MTSSRPIRSRDGAVPIVRTILAMIVLATSAAACSSDGTGGSTTVTSEATIRNRVDAVRDWSDTIEWTSCGTGLECGSFEVPYDYARPDAGVFVLPVKRRIADDPERRIGSLLVNPGGPGGSALQYAEYADSVFSADLLRVFDIVAWDPRGVGGSEPSVDCVDTFDDYFALDPSPDDDTETKALIDGARDFADGCVERSAEILDHVSTVDAASDMDVLRRALDESKISYLGFSYGTQLGATWATLFPETVRAAVFDAAVDPTLGYVDGLVLQAGGFEQSLNTYLDWCDTNGCLWVPEGTDPHDAFADLAASLDARPLPNGDRPATNQGVLGIGSSDALYADWLWSDLSDALAAAEQGDGAGLLALFDDYFGGWSNGHPDDLIDTYFAVTCADRDEAVTPEQILGLADRLDEVAPLIGAGWVQEMLVCASWPRDPVGTIGIGADTDTRIVVVGSTGDAATPLSGTLNMVRQLGNARVIVSTLEQHTTYGADDCVTEAVDEYLIELVDGPDRLDC